MFSWARQRLDAMQGMSLMGDGMLVRLRSASIALLGLVTVVGLGLIVFIAQLGFPGVFSSPIPDDRTEVGTVHGAIALADGGGALQSPHLRSQGRPRTASASGRVHPGVDADLGGSRQLVVSPGAQPSPTTGTSLPPAAAPEPASQPAMPAPVSSPPPVPTPDSTTVSAPKPSSEAQAKKPSSPGSKSKSKSSGSASAKATTDKGKSEGSSPGKSKGQQGGKATVNYTPPSKSKSDDSSDKAEEDQISPPPKTIVPVPVEPKSKQAPEVPKMGAEKETVDSGKSDKSRH